MQVDVESVSAKVDEIEKRVLAEGNVYHVTVSAAELKWLFHSFRSLAEELLRCRRRVANQKAQLRSFERKRRSL